MERKRGQQKLQALFLLAAVVLSQNLVFSLANFQDQKNYYYFPPIPHVGTPPSDPHVGTPPVDPHVGTPPVDPYVGTPPVDPHVGTPPAVPHFPPAHTTPTPHHRGGSYGHPPPANCGNPPRRGRGGGHHHTPSPPRSGSSGYYRPPTPTPTPTPTTPTPVIVSPPSIITPPTTPTPIITPGTPTTPGITVPSPPFSFDPNSPPFSCTWWRNHPTLIWNLLGWWGTTIGSIFGAPSTPRSGSNMSILQALSNTRTDGLGDLYREGTAALLNSMAHTRFPYTTSQVRDSFIAALGSNKAAAAQAQIFKLANEGRTKTRA